MVSAEGAAAPYQAAPRQPDNWNVSPHRSSLTVFHFHGLELRSEQLGSFSPAHQKNPKSKVSGDFTAIKDSPGGLWIGRVYCAMLLSLPAPPVLQQNFGVANLPPAQSVCTRTSAPPMGTIHATQTCRPQSLPHPLHRSLATASSGIVCAGIAVCLPPNASTKPPSGTHCDIQFGLLTLKPVTYSLPLRGAPLPPAHERNARGDASLTRSGR